LRIESGTAFGARFACGKRRDNLKVKSGSARSEERLGAGFACARRRDNLKENRGLEWRVLECFNVELQASFPEKRNEVRDTGQVLV
jgi:hypothetical protein